MAHIALTDEELKKVDQVCGEHDPETHPLTAAIVEGLSVESRGAVLNHYRRAIRGELVLGLLLRGMLETAVAMDAITEEHAKWHLGAAWDKCMMPSIIRSYKWGVDLDYLTDERVVVGRELHREQTALLVGVERPSAAFDALLDLAHIEMFPESSNPDSFLRYLNEADDGGG